MKSSTVNISFNDELLKKIDEVATEESRSRSELIREAARSYIDRKNKWNSIFESGRKSAKKKGLSIKDVESEIAEYRKEKRK
jgi:CopG family transcriptional regulator / antitoxin EndoAI